MCVWRKNTWTRYWGIFIWSLYLHRIEDFIFSSSISKIDLQLLANIFGSKHLPMCILRSVLLGFLLARRVMPKTAPWCYFIVECCLKDVLGVSCKSQRYFSLERKIFPRDSCAMGRMCWWGAPPLGWHLFFSLLLFKPNFCIFSLWFELRLWVYWFTWTFGAAGEWTEQVKV